jgi:hypothetical protein
VPVENCQTVVFAAYVTARAHALFDFRLYLLKQWSQDKERREQAHVPDEMEFTTKAALGTAMLTGAAAGGVPFAWAAADEVYGRSAKLREGREGICRRGAGDLPGHAPVRAEAHRIRRGPVDSGRGMGDPLVRARLQGPSCQGLSAGVCHEASTLGSIGHSRYASMFS